MEETKGNEGEGERERKDCNTCQDVGLLVFFSEDGAC